MVACRTRSLVTVFLALALVWALAGWAGAQSGEPITIRYWQYYYETKVKAIDQLIEQFEAENPGIRVIHETFPYEAYGARVAAAVPAGQGPEVVNLFYGWLPAWVRAGYLEPLPIDAAEIEREFVPMVRAAFMNGEYWGLPTGVRTLALFYNKDLLNQAGFQEPPQTWDEFIAAGQAMAERRGPFYTRLGFGFGPAGQDHHLIREVLIRQFGGQPYDDENRRVLYNSEAGVKALEFYTDWQLKHGLGDVEFFPGRADYRDGFIAGLIGMIIDGSFAIATIRNGVGDQFAWGVTELPVFDPNDRHNFGSFWMNGLTARAFEDPAKLEASLKFLRFITSEEAMKLWLEQVGELPARLSLADDPELAEDPVYGPFIRSLPYSHATFFVDEEGQRRVMVDAINRVLLEGTDPATSIRIAAEEEQRILDQFWNR
ncbi:MULTISPECIES: extracellular solute-binding protein [Limnochorda]|uniref:extracellular solute-binding protein n=1 Tax=Limnochorda TaxID=1676651 RepID=UPI0026ED111A|nr:extracellular solute-binding protein [Limnochorda pilosa]